MQMGKRGRKKRRVVLTKAENQYRHTQKRFVQRFGVIINKDTYNALCVQIRENRAEFISKTSNRVSLFWITLHDVRYPVVYDRVRGTIATVLNPDWIAQNAECDLLCE